MKSLLLIIFLLITAFGYWLRHLNLKNLKRHGHTVPHELQGSIDPAMLERISDYTIETSRLGMVESIADNIILVFFLFGGVIVSYDHLIGSLSSSFIWGGLLFFLVLMYAETLISVPFSLYRNFRIENKFGFNTMSLRLWFVDFLKSAAVSTTLGAIVIISALLIIQTSPLWWWFWVWGLFLVFSIFIMYISPYVIEPLFFKFEPIKKEGLEAHIRSLVERAGLKVSRVFQVDASRRSRHSNAYFTGIGKVKRIVLFDTLIEQMSPDEILAVLAHEIGHWKKRHVLKRILMTEALSLVGLYGAFQLLQGNWLPYLLGIESASFYAKLIIVAFFGSLVLFPLTPLFNVLSRHDERQADRFASWLTGRPEAMISALVKLSRDNLSNLHPHPLYAKFYYSHPPVVERIRKLKSLESEVRS